MIKKFINNNNLVFLSSSISILFLILIPFYELNYVFHIYNYFFLILCFVSAFLGLKLGSVNRKINIDKFKTKLSSYNKALIIINIISIFGLALSFYEYFFIRGLSFTIDIAYNRAKWDASNTTLFSAIVALTQTFSLFVLPICIQKNFYHNDKKYLVLSIFVFVGYLYFTLLNGSRLQIFSSILIQLLTYGYYYKINKIFVIISMILFIFFSGYYLNLRLSVYDSNLLDSLFFSGYSFTISPYDDYLEFASKSFFFYSLYSIYFYLIHGVFEFLYLVENSIIFYDLGKNIFWLPLKFISIFVDINLISNDSYRQGIFNTFAGIFFRDFKFLSPFFIFIMFYFLAFPSKKLKENDELWLFVAVPVSICLLYSPIMSGFGSGPILYYMITSLAIRLIFYFIK